MPTPTLSAIYRYPVKSLRGQSFDALNADSRGLVGDRRWMVVDADGRFLTQRQLARMALVDARFDTGDVLCLDAPGMPTLRVVGGDEPCQVEVWRDRVGAVGGDLAADRWLSEFLGMPCRLVHQPEDSRRPVDPDFARPDDQVGFADGFPFLLISQASLDALNARLELPVPMLRFRPNLVVAGCDAHAEDGWRRIRIGDMTFRVVKPCSRCVIPTVDIDTAERGREPLATLMSYRKRDNKIYFGQNLIHDAPGSLRVGMPVEIVE
ncbi:MAG: MOSC domain-containing protein [Gammaproteobacteria bacterium]|nr:MOSC domain-containing protein [Gammaproteobacteria bacterium]